MRSIMVVGLLLAGCGGGVQHREPDEYTGCGTDEHWQIFDDNEANAITAAATAPTLTQPGDGASVPASPKLVVKWNQDPNDPGMNAGDVAYMNGPGCNQCCPQFNPGALATLHDPPISGDAYDLQFSVGGSVVWRVVTTLQEWTAPDTLWTTWKGKTVTLRLYRMSLLVNQLKQGPYSAPSPFSFRVGS